MVPKHLADPLRWKKPRRIFVNSMSDLFHEKLSNEQIAAVFGVMAAAPQHTFQVLTKRAKRMREWFAWMNEQVEIDGDPWTTLMRETTSLIGVDTAWAKYLDENDHVEDACFEPWPLPHVWLGASVENQEAADERIPELLATPAEMRFLSCEPLLGSVDLTRIGEFRGESLSALEEVVGHVERPRIDWIIAGCESGPGARACEVNWLRELRDQCANAGVAYFLKQAELVPAVGGPLVTLGKGAKQKGRGPREVIIELPYLDGVQHAAFPEVSP